MAMRERPMGVNEQHEISAIGPCFHEELSGNGDQDITCDDPQVKSCNLFHKRHLRGVTDRNVPGISYAPTHELAPN